MSIEEERIRIVDIATDLKVGEVQKFHGKYVFSCFKTKESFESYLGVNFAVAYHAPTRNYVVVRMS